MKNRPTVDAHKMEHLFKKHYKLLCLVSFGIVKDRDTAKDIAQDFFVSYWQRGGSVSLKVSFKAYAVRAVKNLSLLSLKRAKKEKKLVQNMNLLDSSQQRAFDEAGKGKKLQKLLNKLPEGRRQIFMAFVVHGQSYSEIAETNGISINTVKTQMKRAYDFLRSEATEDLLYFLLMTISIY